MCVCAHVRAYDVYIILIIYFNHFEQVLRVSVSIETLGSEYLETEIKQESIASQTNVLKIASIL